MLKREGTDIQISTKPQEAKKLVPATMPLNISAADKAALLAKWDAQAQARHAAVEHEYATPTEAGIVLRFELKKFGKHWQAYAPSKSGKRLVPLLQSPSLLSSALAMLADEMYVQCVNAKR